MVVLHGHAESVEKHQNDDKPVKPLLLDGTPDPESVSLRKTMSHNGIPKDVKRCYLAILSEKDTAFIFAPHPFQATFNLMTALKVNAILLEMRSDPKRVLQHVELPDLLLTSPELLATALVAHSRAEC